ncbi:MAG: O-methyltransferase [Polyangiales bacterium]
MTQTLWTAVDHYFADLLLPSDEALEFALANSRAVGLPDIAVAPNQGKLLWMMAKLQGARRILEIGTLGGYSTIWLARAVPSHGHVVTLEIDPKHAEVARANVAHAGLASVVDVRVGRASDQLASLEREGGAPFDFTFIDADKQSGAEYFAVALRMSRVGSAIVVDNVVRNGDVIDAKSTEERVVGTRRLHEAIAKETRVTATTLQTVGSKGHDGFTIALVVK